MADSTTGGTAQASEGLLQSLLNLVKRLFGGGSSDAGHASAPAAASTPTPPSSSPAASTPATAAPAAAAAAPSAKAAAGPSSSSTVVANPGWEEDIYGMFNPFVEQMAWRFNLASYEDVRANATIILGRINGGGMPPPNYPPLSDDQIQTYSNWVNNDCPLNRPPPTTTTAATTLAGNQQVRPVKFP